MARPRSDILDRLQYVAVRLFSMFLHFFPVNTNLQTARVLGSLMCAIDRKHRERALANLRRSFPELSESHLQKIACRSMQSLVMFFVETLFTTRLVRIDTWSRYVRLANFREVLALMLRKPGERRGLIMLTGHYGNFEILGYTLATLGFPMASVARPLDNPYLSRWLFDVRERQGQKIIAKKGATEEVTDVLAAGGTVAFVADQNAGPKGLFVDFFGRKASTYKSIGLLAMEYDVPVVIGGARRLGDRFEFLVEAQDIIHPADWRNEADPLRYITQRYSTALENLIRKDPGQYWWIHRRWKSRPKGEEAMAYD